MIPNFTQLRDLLQDAARSSGPAPKGTPEDVARPERPRHGLVSEAFCMRGSGPGRFLCRLLLWCAGLGLLAPTLATAIPPPLARPALVPDLHADGGTRVIEDEVRAYQAVPLSFHANAGDELLLWLVDSERLLVLDVEAPSDLRWVSGAVPGPDGLRLRLMETGVYRSYVVMTGDAARMGKAARFQLRLKLVR